MNFGRLGIFTTPVVPKVSHVSSVISPSPMQPTILPFSSSVENRAKPTAPGFSDPVQRAEAGVVGIALDGHRVGAGLDRLS